MKFLPHRRLDVQPVIDPETGKKYYVATTITEVREGSRKPIVVADTYLTDAGNHTTPAVRFGTKVFSLAEFSKDMEGEGMELLALVVENLPEAIREFERNLTIDSKHSS